MGSVYFLPKKGSPSVPRAMRLSLDRAKDNRKGRSLLWIIYSFYLQGIREFNFLNMTEGRVRVNWLTKDNKVPFKFQKLLKLYMTEFGRLLTVDTSPKVRATVESLVSHRDKAVSQVVLDAMVNSKNREEATQNIIQMLLTFGMAGLAPDIFGTPDKGIKAELESIPPWELNPVPHNPMTLAQLAGDQRDRYVPLEWLVEKFGKNLLASKGNLEKLKLRTVAFGEEPPDIKSAEINRGEGDIESDIGSPTDTKMTLSKLLEMKEALPYAHFHEMWLRGKNGELSRYLARCGDLILSDQPFDNGSGEIYPVYTSRYIDNGTYWGQGMIDLLISLNREAERNLAQLFNNARSIDGYGMLVLPSSMAAQAKVHTKTEGNLKVLFWDPPHFQGAQPRPLPISPVTAGDFPGKVASLIVAELESLGKDVSLELPARTDSPTMVQLIDSAGRRPIAQAVKGIAQQFGGAYQYIVYRSDEFFMQQRPVFLTHIDDNIAGIAMDPKTRAVRLENVNKPNMEGLEFGIRSDNPNEKEMIIQKLREWVQMGAINPADVPWINMKMQLGLPFPETPELNTARTAMLNNILLFNDGETPGQIIASTVDTPRVALQVVTTFMTRPIFRLASVDVREAFEQLRQGYQQVMTVPQMQAPGQPLPEEIMNRALSREAEGGTLTQRQGANGRMPS